MCHFHKKTIIRHIVSQMYTSMPQLNTMLGPRTTLISPTVELSNYDTGFHYYHSYAAIVNPKQIWNPVTNTLSYKTPCYTGSWSFNGQNMTAVLKSQKLSYNLRMDGASQVMWAKDGRRLLLSLNVGQSFEERPEEQYYRYRCCCCSYHIISALCF
jgi:hypothetical protein